MSGLLDRSMMAVKIHFAQGSGEPDQVRRFLIWKRQMFTGSFQDARNLTI
jgi:hypothetical protein